MPRHSKAFRLPVWPGAATLWAWSLAAGSGGCEGEVAGPRPAPTAVESSSSSPPIRCLVGTEAGDQRSAIALAQKLFGHLRSGDLPTVWSHVHPALRDDTRREPFLAALADLRGQLPAVAPESLQATEIRVVRVAPGVRDTLRVQCPASVPSGADEATVVTQVDGQDLVFLELGLGGAPLDRGLAFKLRADDHDWGLVDVRVLPRTFRDRDSADYAQRGEQLRQSGDLLPAYFAFGIAQTLLNSGQGLEFAAASAVADQLRQIGRDPSFVAQTDRWTVAGTDYELIRVGLHALDQTLLPAVSYVTHLSLDDEDAIRREAGSLAKHLQSTFPAVEQLLDGVVFEAYAERPTVPGRAYDAGRVIIFFGEDPATDP